MNLEQQIRRYGEEVEAHAIAISEPPELPAGREHDIAHEVASTRQVGRTRLLAMCAAVVVVLLAGIAAVVIDRRDDQQTLDAVGSDPSDPASEPAPSPPAEPDGPFSLWLSATRVPLGPTELVAVLINHDGTDATFGVGATVERWDGRTWVPHRQVLLCMDHWSCTARLGPLDEQQDVPAIGLGATVEHPGPVERFTTDGLDVGWYRLSQQANEQVVAAAIFEVASDASAPAPLWPIDRPAISVSPPLLDRSGGSVTLSPLVPDAGDVSDYERAVTGLTETASVERWDGEAWAQVTDIALGQAPPQASLTERTATMPPLEPGSYRLVRTGPLGPQVGSFWVLEPQLPSPATPNTDPDGSAVATTTSPNTTGPSGTQPPEATVTVFVATGVISRGMSGEDAVAQGLVGPAEIPSQFAPSTRILTLDVLSEKVAIFDIAPDTVIVEGMFIDPTPP